MATRDESKIHRELEECRAIIDRQRQHIHDIRDLNSQLVQTIVELGVKDPHLFAAPAASIYQASSGLPRIPRKTPRDVVTVPVGAAASRKIVRPAYTSSLAEDIVSMSNYIKDLEEAREMQGQMARHAVSFSLCRSLRHSLLPFRTRPLFVHI